MNVRFRVLGLGDDVYSYFGANLEGFPVLDSVVIITESDNPGIQSGTYRVASHELRLAIVNTSRARADYSGPLIYLERTS